MIHHSIQFIAARVRRLVNHLLDPIFGYSRIVFGTKTLLLALAGLLTLLIIAMPLFNQKPKHFIPTTHDPSLRRLATPTMMNPHFEGSDTKGQFFLIDADTAIKTPDDKVALTSVNARIQLNSGERIYSDSTHAVYDINDGGLDLLGEVNMRTDDGYKLRTASAHIDLKTRITTGRNKITLTGDVGVLSAEEFSLENDQRMIFEKKVKMILYPNHFSRALKTKPTLPNPQNKAKDEAESTIKP